MKKVILILVIILGLIGCGDQRINRVKNSRASNKVEYTNLEFVESLSKNLSEKEGFITKIQWTKDHKSVTAKILAHQPLKKDKKRVKIRLCFNIVKTKIYYSNSIAQVYVDGRKIHQSKYLDFLYNNSKN